MAARATIRCLGGGGNDSYYVDSLGDVVNEQAIGSDGIDTILAIIDYSLANAQVKGIVENLKLTGTLNIDGTGDTLANSITGNSGNNVLDGGRGIDTLTGAGGADRFTFSTVLSTATNRDTITDFTHNIDKIVLDSAIFGAVGPVGTLAATRFALNAPTDGNDTIIYNSTTGVVFYDADGNGAGAAIQFAKLTGVPGVTQADFLII